MELKSDFEVSVGVDRAWEVLTNPELIAPCLPGARLDEVEGDEFRGAVKVRVGPISSEYRGKATMVEMNRDDLRIVIRAEGRDTRGAGNASADITAVMEAGSESTTKIEVTTDLKISGKVAQFGRGVLGDVSAKLMGRFVDNLEAMLQESAEADATAAGADGGEATSSSDSDAGEGGDSGAGAAGSGDSGAGDTSSGAGAASSASSDAPPAAPKPAPAEPEAVDLLKTIPSKLKILAPIIAVVAGLGLLLKRLLGRRNAS